MKSHVTWVLSVACQPACTRAEAGTQFTCVNTEGLINAFVKIWYFVLSEQLPLDSTRNVQCMSGKFLVSVSVNSGTAAVNTKESYKVVFNTLHVFLSGNFTVSVLNIVQCQIHRLKCFGSKCEMMCSYKESNVACLIICAISNIHRLL